MGECWLGAQYRSAECGDPKIAGFVTYILVRIAAGAELVNATKKGGTAVDLLQIQQT
jgi:hypothetical protein